MRRDANQAGPALTTNAADASLWADDCLLISQRLDGVEASSLARRVEAEEDTHCY